MSENVTQLFLLHNQINIDLKQFKQSWKNSWLKICLLTQFWQETFLILSVPQDRVEQKNLKYLTDNIFVYDLITLLQFLLPPIFIIAGQCDGM